jgi:hypothetical protein
MAKGQPRFPWLSYVVILVVIWLFTLSPFIALAFINAGQTRSPMQLTELMASWGVLGWLVLAPIPLGMIAFGGWLIALIVHLLVRRRQARKAETP